MKPLYREIPTNLRHTSDVFSGLGIYYNTKEDHVECYKGRLSKEDIENGVWEFTTPTEVFYGNHYWVTILACRNTHIMKLRQIKESNGK